MRKLVLTAAVVLAFAWLFSGAAFCQEKGERREGKGRLEEDERRKEWKKKMRDRRRPMDEEGGWGRMPGRDPMEPGGERGERMERMREFLKQRRGERDLDPETRERMKEIGELEKQSRELAEQYRRAETDEEKQNIVQDLRPVLVRAFDLKLLNQEKNVERLEKKLKELKDLLGKRKESRDEVIEKRLDELTGRTEHLKW